MPQREIPSKGCAAFLLVKLLDDCKTSEQEPRKWAPDLSLWLFGNPFLFWDCTFAHDRMCVIATSLLVYRFLIVSSQCSFPLPSDWAPIVIWPMTSSEVRRSWFMILIVIEYSSMVSPSTSNKKPWFQTGFTPRVVLVCLVSSIASFAFRFTQTYGAVKRGEKPLWRKASV